MTVPSAPRGLATIWVRHVEAAFPNGGLPLGIEWLPEVVPGGLRRAVAPDPVHEVFGALNHFSLRATPDPEVVRLLRALAADPGAYATGLGVIRMGTATAFAEWVQTLGYRLGI